MRRVIAGTLLALAVAWGASAEPVRPDQRILFTPAPLGGAGMGGFERESSLQPSSVTTPAIPAPKPRPSATTTTYPAANATPPRTNLPKVDLSGAFGGSSRTAVLAAPQPEALDLSHGVDLGGVSLGLDTGRGGYGGTAPRNLLSPEAKDPVPTDPTIIKKGTPFLGLSLSAPTN